MFDSSGEITPPCGVPASIADLAPVFHHSRSEPLPQQLEHPSVRDAPRHELHQLLVIDAAEVVPDVGVEHVVRTRGPELPHRLQSARRAPPGPEAVRARKKVRLEDRLQHQLRRHLHHSVPDRRDAQRPLLPIRLRDVPAQDRSRPVRACAQLRADLLQEALDSVALDLRERLGIDPRSALVPSHPLPRLPQDVTPVDAVIQRVETPTRRPLGRHPQPALELSHFVRGSRPRGWLGPVLPAMPSRLPPPPTRPPQGPFPPAALFVTAIAGTTIPSDSRCAALAFAFGLYGPPRRDHGRADGSLLFRTAPCTRAAPPTPPGPPALAPVLVRDGVAFAVT